MYTYGLFLRNKHTTKTDVIWFTDLCHYMRRNVVPSELPPVSLLLQQPALWGHA